MGGFVDVNDVERRHLTRIASVELDKLALYRGVEPITADDVRTLVAEAVPGSVWAFTDAVGERRLAVALELLERLLDATPEPVLLAVSTVAWASRLGDRLAGGGVWRRRQSWGSPANARPRPWRTIRLDDGRSLARSTTSSTRRHGQGAPDPGRDGARRRLASLWVMDMADAAAPLACVSGRRRRRTPGPPRHRTAVPLAIQAKAPAAKGGALRRA
jgi:hypothetical protein